MDDYITMPNTGNTSNTGQRILAGQTAAPGFVGSDRCISSRLQVIDYIVTTLYIVHTYILHTHGTTDVSRIDLPASALSSDRYGRIGLDRLPTSVSSGSWSLRGGSSPEAKAKAKGKRQKAKGEKNNPIPLPIQERVGSGRGANPSTGRHPQDLQRSSEEPCNLISLTRDQ